MRKRNLKRRNRSFGIQRLEDRRLLAADVAVDLVPVESAEPEMCQVAELETQVESADQGELFDLDLDSTEISVEEIENAIDVATSDAASDVEADVEVDAGADAGEQSESPAHDLGDPVDGTDGFFGSIDAENPESQLSFTPSEEGQIDIVVASSFGGAETRLEVTDSAGDLVTSTVTEDLSEFQKLSFEAEAGETYQLSVSSEEGTEGYFQVTIGHSDIPEPVDLHADSIGEESTQLEIVDGSSNLEGDLELAGDVDTFRFTAESDGTALLGLAELDAASSTELQVQVLSADGNLLTRGITNETVGVSFAVEQGAEYFLSVSAAEGQTGTFGLDLAIESTVADPEPGLDVVDESPVDDQPEDEQLIDDGGVEDILDDQLVDDEPVVDDVEDVVIDEIDAVDEAVVDDEPVVENADDAIVDDVVIDVVDEAIEDQPSVDQPIEVEIVTDQPAADQPIVEIIDAVDSEETFDDVVLDSTDVPAIFESGDTLTDDIEGETEADDDVVDDLASDSGDTPTEIITDAEDELAEQLDDSDVFSVDDLIDQENGICYTDLILGEGEAIDSFFAQFDPSSIFQVRHGFGLRS